jgi:hypothetical protein
MAILEDLNSTIDQKKKVEDELELAQEKMQKMDELMKNIEEDKKKIEDEKMQLELHITNIVDDYKNKANEKRLKRRRIKRHAIEI